MVIDAHLRHQCRRRGHVVASVLQTGQRFPQRNGVGNCISLLRRIDRFQFSQVAGNVCIERCHLPFQLPAADHLALAGDCLKLRTINCDQLATNQALTPAESHEDPARRREGRAILPAKIGDGLEVRRQPLQQPEHFKISAEQFSEAAQTALGSVPEATKPITESFIDLTLVANEAASTMADTFTNALFDPMDKSIKEMLASFLKAIAKMIAQALILKAVKSGMELMGLKFANGGVFDQGGVQAFASGGVVTRPTPFKFASGGSFKSGLMGEAGPEAILPLKRGSDGKLGVTMNNAGSAGDTVVNITVNQSSESKDSNGPNNEAKQFANMIKSAVLQVIVTEKRPGGILWQ